MIRITVELISSVHPSRNRVLGVATIVNDGTGTVTRGNYTSKLLDKRGRAYRTGNVSNYPRKDKSFWCLIAAGIAGCLR